MSLRILDDLEQGTPEWFAARRGIVTASVVGKLLSVGGLGAIDYDCPACGAGTNAACLSKSGKEPKPIKTLHPERTAVAEANRATSPLVITSAVTDEARTLTATLAAERVSGNTDPTYMSSDMFRGVEDEPRAVEVYADNYAPVTTVGFMVEDRWGFPIGYSPDGLVGDDGLIEVKSRRQKTQLLDTIAGKVPTFNMPQLQCGLLVSGRKWIDYISYCGGMPMFVERVLPDPVWFDAIVLAVAEFEVAAERLVAEYATASTGFAPTERVSLDNLGLVF